MLFLGLGIEFFVVFSMAALGASSSGLFPVRQLVVVVADSSDRLLQFACCVLCLVATGVALLGRVSCFFFVPAFVETVFSVSVLETTASKSWYSSLSFPFPSAVDQTSVFELLVQRSRSKWARVLAV